MNASADAAMLYKLMVLYMLDRIDLRLSNSQISEFILDKGYTNYFTLQECFKDLEESELIRREQLRTTTFYEITPDGQETLHSFGHMISDGILEDMDLFLSEHRYQLRNENEVITDYYKENTDSYIVRCKLIDRKETLLEVDLGVSCEDEAITACENWKKLNQDIYGYMVRQLMIRH